MDFTLKRLDLAMTVVPASAYEALRVELTRSFPPERIVNDPLRLFAYGTDASCYRLVPRLVVKVEDETEVRTLLRACRRRGLPLTFRAAGTSLSGQAVSDSVLAVLGRGWKGIAVGEGGASITVQPGVIGADANRALAIHNRKIGPDPASINACKIGGIVANNASGMCCGTEQNTYRTMRGVRLILSDGAVLDTRDADSVAAFRRSHALLLAALDDLARRTRGDEALRRRIVEKYRIKNTTGYSLNALVDFEDPVDILAHLMVGSEGTLGFVSEITYETVPDHPFKASALVLFPDLASACAAAAGLRPAPVMAAELMDGAALRSVRGKPGMPAHLAGLPADAAALLLEVRGEDEKALDRNIAAVTAALAGLETTEPPAFTTDAQEIAGLWNVRKGLFPSVAAVREAGSGVIIEDVAFPTHRLAEGAVALRRLLADHGYGDAILFGHALAGNLHFVIAPRLGTEAEARRFGDFLEGLAHLVVLYGGSLKAEHGTGRNVAPFVALEWGTQAYALMREIKRLLDPEGILNPGVILNADPTAHLASLKAMPLADPVVDKCMECGFCESVCPSRHLTLTPRQRIAGWREAMRLADESPAAAASWRRSYRYDGIETCAACGLCATACPVGIETGVLIKALRGRERGPVANALAHLTRRNHSLVEGAARWGLRASGLTGGRLPGLPLKLPRPARPPRPSRSDGDPVVYFASCAGRTFGPTRGDAGGMALPDAMVAVLERAGYRVLLPGKPDSLCCGKPYDSKGLFAEADLAAEAVARALEEASDGGRLPIVCDTSPCSERLKKHLDGRLAVHDVAEFLHDHVLPRLEVQPVAEAVALHITCSARRMGLEGKLRALAAACANRVVVPDDITCCGFAGDKGFTTPELNASALRDLPALLDGATEGVSTSRTCEMGLSHHASVPYRALVELVERASRPGRTQSWNR